MKTIEKRWARIRRLMADTGMSQRQVRKAWDPHMHQSTFSWILNEQRIKEETADLERWLVEQAKGRRRA
jgi:hypothetical protein